MRRDDIRRLTEERKQVFADMHKLNEDAEKENRSLSPEENEKFEKMPRSSRSFRNARRVP
jgi:hypothetical protein